MNDAELSDAVSDEINLGRYVAILLHWWRLIVLCAVIGGVAALFYTLQLPRAYESEANIAIVRTTTTVNFDPKIRTVSNTDANGLQSVDQTSLRKALTLIADNDNLAQAVFDSLKTQLDPSIGDAKALHDLVAISNDGDLIQVKVAAGSPKDAALIANAWVREYLNRANEIYGENPVSLELLSGQLHAARQDYDDTLASVVANLRESQISALQQRRDEKTQVLVNLLAGKNAALQAVITETQQVQIKLLRDYLGAIGDSRSTVFTLQVSARVQKLQDLYASQLKLTRLLDNARTLRARLSGSPGQSQPGTDLALTLLDASAFTTWADLPLNVQVQLDNLGSGATPSAQLQALDSLISELEKNRTASQAQIEDASKSLLADTGYSFLDARTDARTSPLSAAIQERAQALLNLEGLDYIASSPSADTAVLAAIETLQKDINSLDSQIESENARRRELVRARDLAWDKYSTLANKMAESEVVQGSGSSMVRLATPAMTPTEPVATKRLTTSLLGLVLGLLAGCILAFILDARSGGLSGEQQVAAALGVDVLTTVPVSSAFAAPGKSPPVVAEAFRTLRYQISAKNVQVVALTGSVVGEGVTTLALNLAIAAAQADKRVLLVDANLRHPRIAGLLKESQSPGLAEFLKTASVETLQWQTFVRPSNIANLSIFPAGEPTPDPAALYEKPSLEHLFKGLRSKFDLIILDTPPVIGLVDTVALARVVDGVVLVIDSAHTPRAAAATAKQILANSGASLLGVVLNRGSDTGRTQSVSNQNVDGSARVKPYRNFWSGLWSQLIQWVGPRPGG